MQGSPRDYLPLPEGADLNASTFSNGTDHVRTAYEKLRVDPATFAVDLGDTTFASSTGSAVAQGTTITSVPYGVAFACNGAMATMSVDLHGTQFRLEEPFSAFRTGAHATVSFSDDRRSLSETVTGDCAWIAPTAQVKPESDAPQSELYLAFFPSAS